MKRFLPKHISSILFLSIFVLSFFLRAQETLSHNFLFLLDQGRDMMAVKQIVYDHHITLIGPYTSLAGVFQGPLWYYLLAIPTFIFRGDPWGGVLLMLLVSMSTICVAYIGMKKLFGTNAAFFTTFLFAVSPQAIAAATYAWNPHPMWLIVVAYIFIFYLALQKERYTLFLWPTILLSFHFQTALGVFLFFTTIIFLLLRKRSIFFCRYSLVGFALGLLVISPQFLFELRHNFLMTRSVLMLLAGSNQGLVAGYEGKGLQALLSSHAYEFVINFRSAFLYNGLSVIFPLIFFVLTIYVLIANRLELSEKKFVLFCLQLVSILISIGLVYPFPIRGWFLTGIEGIYLLIIGVVTGNLWKQSIGKLLISLIILLSLISVSGKLHELYIRPPNDGGVAKVKGKLAVIDAIYADANGKPFNLFVFTPPVKTDAYDYLVWYRAQQYGYMPTHDKKGLAYLLIEPDHSQPWSYKGWLETVIVTGNVVSTQTQESGLIIQKRTFNE